MIATKRLFTVIQKSLKEQNLDKLNAFLSSTDTTGVLNETTLFSLGTLLKKHKNEKSLPANCVLSCLQHFVDKQIDPVKWEALADSVGKLCDVVFCFSARHIKDEELIGENINTFTAILENRKVVANGMLQFTMDTLLKVASDDTYSHAIRMDLLTLISSIVSKSTYELRREVIPKKILSLNKLSNILAICGDYEMQVAIVDVLVRSWFHLKDREDVNADLFTEFPNVMDIFKSLKCLNVDTEGRLFLNILNNGMGDNQSVYSIPCLVVIIDKMRYKKPSDPSYKEFWVDFNVSTKRISFYYQTSPNEPWELKTISGDIIDSVNAVNSSCKSRSGEAILTIKIEIVLKAEEGNSEKSKLLKIYARKCKEFEKLEKRDMKEIFQDKYKTAVTYEDINTSLQAINSPAKKQPESNESKSKEECSSATMNNNIYENSTFISKSLDESDCNKSGKACSPQFERSGKYEELNESQDDSRHSFSHYIKQLKQQESNSNQSKDQNTIVQTKGTLAKAISKQENNTVGIQALSDVCKISSLDNEQMKVNKMDEQNNVFHPEGTMFTIPDQPSPNCDGLNAKRRRLFSSETNNVKDIVMSSQEDCPAEVPSYKLHAKKEFKMKPKMDVDRTKITYSYISHKEKEKQRDKCNTSSTFTDSKIFSVSSDEEEDQACTKKEIKKNNALETNQKEHYPIASTPHKENYLDKRLLALNSTHEDVEISSIFPSTSQYPNRFASEKDTHFKNTYARPKAKRLGKRKKTVFNALLYSSDSEDLDYVNPTIKPPTLEDFDRKGNKKEVSLNVNRFVNSIPCRPDPMRNIKHVNEDMKMDPAPPNQMDVDVPREIEVGPAVEPISDVPQRGRRKAVVGGKKNVPSKINKVPKVKKVQTRKPRGKKELVCSEQSVENELPNELTTIYSENNKPQGNEDCTDHTMAHDVQISQLFKDSEMSESPATLTVMNQFLSEAQVKVRNVLTHSQKEREMYCSMFSFKTHSSVNVLEDQTKKLMIINSNLLKVKTLLDTTIDLHNEVYQQIEKEVNQLEETKQTFLENLSNVEKTQSSKIVSMFQELGQFMKNSSSKDILPKNK